MEISEGRGQREDRTAKCQGSHTDRAVASQDKVQAWTRCRLTLSCDVTPEVAEAAREMAEETREAITMGNRPRCYVHALHQGWWGKSKVGICSVLTGGAGANARRWRTIFGGRWRAALKRRAR